MAPSAHIWPSRHVAFNSQLWWHELSFFAGNLALEPEVAHEAELGLDWQRGAFRIAHHLVGILAGRLAHRLANAGDKPLNLGGWYLFEDPLGLTVEHLHDHTVDLAVVVERDAPIEVSHGLL